MERAVERKRAREIMAMTRRMVSYPPRVPNVMPLLGGALVALGWFAKGYTLHLVWNFKKYVFVTFLRFIKLVVRRRIGVQ